MMDFRFILVMLKMRRYFWQNNGVHFIWIILYYYILNCTYLYKLEILRINLSCDIYFVIDLLKHILDMFNKTDV